MDLDGRVDVGERKIGGSPRFEAAIHDRNLMMTINLQYSYSYK